MTTATSSITITTITIIVIITILLNAGGFRGSPVISTGLSRHA